MSVEKHFKNNNSISFKDIILYVDLYHDFKLREVVDDLNWQVEAYYIYKIPNTEKTIKIVFEDDTISPREILNQKELEIFLNKLINTMNYVKESLSTRNS